MGMGEGQNSHAQDITAAHDPAHTRPVHLRSCDGHPLHTIFRHELGNLQALRTRPHPPPQTSVPHTTATAKTEWPHINSLLRPCPYLRGPGCWCLVQQRSGPDHHGSPRETRGACIYAERGGGRQGTVLTLCPPDTRPWTCASLAIAFLCLCGDEVVAVCPCEQGPTGG